MRVKRFLYTILFKPHRVIAVLRNVLEKKYVKFALNRQVIKGEFVFLTAADSSHFKTVKQFLESFFKFEKESKIVFYDLGLSDKERHDFKNEFPEVVYHQFNYSEYPDHFDLSTNLGGYAWKPIIFWETLNQYKCKLIWMDAGTLITKPLDNLEKYICWKGYYWHYSPGTIREWTHQKTLSYLEVPSKFYRYRNLSAAAIAVDYKFEDALLVAREWKECAMCEECISPKGSDRSNHRQDQAVLTILAHKRGLAKGVNLRETGFLIQQDID